MKVIFCLLVSAFLLTSAANAAVVKSFDQSNDCTRFSLRHAKSSKDAIKLNSGESIHLKGTIYGFTFKDPQVDFDNRQVSVRAEILKHGFNKDLKKKVFLSDDKVDVNSALKQVNRKVLTMDEVCINHDGELIDFKLPN